MKIYKNFTQYTPEIKLLPNAMHIRDEEGNDWYDLISTFLPDTHKIVVDSNNCVQVANTDASMLFPDTMSVYEVVEVPSNVNNGTYQYIDGEFIKNPHIIEYIARDLRDYIRLQIDTYLKPASTYKNKLVSLEDKDKLIQDSLLLANWTDTPNWPNIPLPTLSDFANSVLTIPNWPE